MLNWRNFAPQPFDDNKSNITTISFTDYWLLTVGSMIPRLRLSVVKSGNSNYPAEPFKIETAEDCRTFTISMEGKVADLIDSAARKLLNQSKATQNKVGIAFMDQILKEVELIKKNGLFDQISLPHI